MAGYRFPNESDEYRARRNELLEMEKDLRAQVDAVAKRRRALPLGGRLKEDYRFEHVGDDGEVEEVAFGELFGEHHSLLLYTMMFGPDWDAACPSCTSLVDGFNASYYPVSRRCAMAVVTAARARQCRDWAEFRGWTSIPLYSAGKSSYVLDYFAREGADDAALVSMMNVFHKTPDGIFHTWGSELVSHPQENGHPCHVDIVWPYWNLLDMTPEGRGEGSVPIQNYEHAYFTKHVLGGENRGQ
jgi:predicted dithiol-disulfide oxidoreductase (DUF899 family)